jgi:hypothetical protein
MLLDASHFSNNLILLLIFFNPSAVVRYCAHSFIVYVIEKSHQDGFLSTKILLFFVVYNYMLIIFNSKLNKFVSLILSNYFKYTLFYCTIALFLPVATVVLTIKPISANYTFTIDINMNLPAYSNLHMPVMPCIMLVLAQGFIFSIPKWLQCIWRCFPNQALSSCSTMTLKGINVVCPWQHRIQSVYRFKSNWIAISFKTISWRLTELICVFIIDYNL